MRNPRNQEDQQIRPPFLENYVVDKYGIDSIEDHIHHFGDLDFEIYLTEEEHSMFAQEDDNRDFEEELEQYQKGYMHAIDDVEKIKLRNRDVIRNKGRLNPNHPSNSQMNTKKRNEKKKKLLYIKKLKIELRKKKS